MENVLLCSMRTTCTVATVGLHSPFHDCNTIQSVADLTLYTTLYMYVKRCYARTRVMIVGAGVRRALAGSQLVAIMLSLAFPQVWTGGHAITLHYYNIFVLYCIVIQCVQVCVLEVTILHYELIGSFRERRLTM